MSELQVVSLSRRSATQELCQYKQEALNLTSDNCKSLYCMTAYNEDDNALILSLYGLLTNILYSNCNSAQHIMNNGMLCIIMDGYQEISPSLLCAAKKLALIDDNPIQFSEEFDLKIYKSTIHGADIYKLFAKAFNRVYNNLRWEEIFSEASNQTVLECLTTSDFSSVSLPVLFCIKAENKGKLDSHWWFYKVLCQQMQPQYCFQIDIGTFPKVRALHNMLNIMENDPSIAAAGGRLEIVPPQSLWNIVHMWDYYDYLSITCLDLPAESYTDSLSLISGGLNIIRWKALQDITDHNGEPASSPLDGYFKSLSPRADQKKNYAQVLAEDRALSYEIISQPGTNWKLEYAASSVAITDRSASLSELIAQRRRWYSGTFSSWLKRSLFNLNNLFNENVSLSQKVKQGASLLFYFFQIMADWFITALLIIINPAIKYAIIASVF